MDHEGLLGLVRSLSVEEVFSHDFFLIQSRLSGYMLLGLFGNPAPERILAPLCSYILFDLFLKPAQEIHSDILLHLTLRTLFPSFGFGKV